MSLLPKAVSEAKAKFTKQGIAAALKDGKDATKLAMELVQGAADEPTRRRYLTNDTTVEKLGELLNKNPNGIIVFRDELSGWLRSLSARFNSPTAMANASRSTSLKWQRRTSKRFAPRSKRFWKRCCPDDRSRRKLRSGWTTRLTCSPKNWRAREKQKELPAGVDDFIHQYLAERVDLKAARSNNFTKSAKTCPSSLATR